MSLELLRPQFRSTNGAKAPSAYFLLAKKNSKDNEVFIALNRAANKAFDCQAAPIGVDRETHELVITKSKGATGEEFRISKTTGRISGLAEALRQLGICFCKGAEHQPPCKQIHVFNRLGKLSGDQLAFKLYSGCVPKPQAIQPRVSTGDRVAMVSDYINDEGHKIPQGIRGVVRATSKVNATVHFDENYTFVVPISHLMRF